MTLVFLLEVAPRLLPAVGLAVAPLGATLLYLTMRTRSVANIALTWSMPAVSACVTTSGVAFNQFLDAHPVANFQLLADAFIWRPHIALALGCLAAAVAGEAEPHDGMPACTAILVSIPLNIFNSIYMYVELHVNTDLEGAAMVQTSTLAFTLGHGHGACSEVVQSSCMRCWS